MDHNQEDSVQVESDLPSLPVAVLSRHPHHPIIFGCIGSYSFSFNYKSGEWAFNPFEKDDACTNADAKPTKDVYYSAMCGRCLSCGARCGQFHALSKCPGKKNERNNISRANDSDNEMPDIFGHTVVATANSDKLIMIWECFNETAGKSHSEMPSFAPAENFIFWKKVVSVIFGSANELIVADKFGDVFSIPVRGKPSAKKQDKVIFQKPPVDILFENTRSAATYNSITRDQTKVSNAKEKNTSDADINARKFTPLSEIQKQGYLDNGYEAKLNDISAESLKGSRFNHEVNECDNLCLDSLPIISHMTSISCLKVFDDSPNISTEAKEHESFLITCDRDSKVRVSALGAPWKIESFFLGHRDFVVDLIIVPLPLSYHTEKNGQKKQFVSRRSYACLTAGADCCLEMWDLKTGTSLPNTRLFLSVPTLFPNERTQENVLKYYTGRIGTDGKALVHLEEGMRGKRCSDDRFVAATKGGLLPIRVVLEPQQNVLIIQTLQLKGLIFIPLVTKQPDLEIPYEQIYVYGASMFLPLDIQDVATFLLTGHCISELQSVPMFNHILTEEESGKLSGCDDHTVPFIWILDRKGFLHPPLCVELEKKSQTQDECGILCFLSANSDNFLRQKTYRMLNTLIAHSCQYEGKDIICPTSSYWLSGRRPDALIQEERSARRLQHKQLQKKMHIGTNGKTVKDLLKAAEIESEA